MTGQNVAVAGCGYWGRNLVRNFSELGALHTICDASPDTLGEMAENGGRDTETDLFGNPGRYVTIMSRNHVGKPCPACGTQIRKAAYMGGSIYFCPDCQPI